MLSLEALRKIDTPSTTNLTDDELTELRQSFYDLGQLIFEDWSEEKLSPKNPVGSLTSKQEGNTM
ncbi:hypothetical protein K9M47_01345 [Candidatus Gracilibacteria bacterium]|nr:hypothetical protein [Candidatus Gracilibacteria bacterium]MCF7899016.1 hypothetical protein [Candidatus Paceibacterota bacterium]